VVVCGKGTAESHKGQTHTNHSTSTKQSNKPNTTQRNQKKLTNKNTKKAYFFRGLHPKPQTTTTPQPHYSTPASKSPTPMDGTRHHVAYMACHLEGETLFVLWNKDDGEIDKQNEECGTRVSTQGAFSRRVNVSLERTHKICG
jgi:hypothetical protein